jgi:hypothetical protein
LEQAEINIRTAERYEQLTGGKEEQMQKVAENSAQAHSAKQREKQELPTMEWLRPGDPAKWGKLAIFA